MKLPENTDINEYIIELVEGKQSIYRPIHVLSLVQLEILKIYIETCLKIGFIQPFELSTSTPILFDKKSNGSFCLCVNYQNPNKLMIKNWYPLPLIKEPQLDLTSTYHQMRM